MNIALQILKEFWLPLCLSALWVAYNLFGGNGEAWDAKKVVNIFGPTFFFFSWLTGQFFRVKKQVKVENSLGSMEKRLERLFEELETKTRNMIDHVSGGNSFPWIQIGMVNSATDKGTRMSLHYFSICAKLRILIARQANCVRRVYTICAIPQQCIVLLRGTARARMCSDCSRNYQPTSATLISDRRSAICE